MAYLEECLDLALAFSDEAYCGALKFKKCNGIYIVTGVSDVLEPQLETLYIDGIFKHIAEGAFKDNPIIKHVVIGYGVHCLHKSCFENCINLETITFRGTIDVVEDRAFKGCFNLKEVHLGGRLYNVGSYVFEDCKSLEVADLGRNVCILGAGVFKNCTSLVKARVQGRYLWKYPEYLFEGCSSLKRYIIPDHIEKILDSCFKDCVNLESIEIPKTVTEIGYCAFLNCDKLQRFVIRGLNIGDGSWSLLMGGCNTVITDLSWICIGDDNVVWVMERKKDD